jgi:hypothetical protein
MHCAADASIQSMAAQAVRASNWGLNAKITVFDRRFNDQLGSMWVKDYKSKN